MKSGCLRSLNVICFFWPNYETKLRSAPDYIDMISSLFKNNAAHKKSALVKKLNASL